MNLLIRKAFIWGNVWYVLCDFNFVFSPHEKVGGDSHEYQIGNYLCVEFCNFISHMEL